jgi:large subunit ribosomal protein L4
MSALFSPEAAQQANLNLTSSPEEGSQALHDTCVAYRANRRQGNAHTKRRGEVAGSGKKLWNQKGTGNARMGSRRSPIWSGGATVFGPRKRDFSKKTNKKARQLAFRAALTARIQDGSVLSVPALSITDGKTKSFVEAIKAITDSRKVLVVGGRFDENTFKAGRNVKSVQLISADEVNAEQLLNYDKVVLTTDALETLARRTA